MPAALGYLVLLSLAHLMTDLTQGGMPALLPHLKESYGLSYAQVGMVLLVLNITSSLIQPVFGYWSDRSQQRWLVVVGPTLGALGLALAGQVRSYEAVLAAAALCGIGVALFHPEGARVARVVSGGRRATAMAVFSVGGNIGFALGPVVALALVRWLGFGGLAWILVPTLLVAAALVASLPGLVRREQQEQAAGGSHPGPSTARANWFAEALLVGVVGVRSWLQFGIVSLLPFLYMEKVGSAGVGTDVLLFIFLAAGALGTVVGGPLADRVGTRTVLIGSMAVLGPIHWALVHGPAWSTLPLLALSGFALVATFSITLVLSQDFLPGRVAVASGLNVGFSIGLGGIGAAALGALADRWGLVPTLEFMTLLPVLGLILAWLVPVPDRDRMDRTMASSHRPRAAQT